MDQEGDAGREWIPLGDFARRLGIARASVYGRIKRGTLEAKPLNKGGYLVQWPPPTHDGSGDVGGNTARRSPGVVGNGSATVAGDIAELRARLAETEFERDELRAGLARAQARIDATAAVAEIEVDAAKRIAAAEVAAARVEIAAVRQASDDRIAARTAALEMVERAHAAEVAAKDAVVAGLEAELARLRLPFWRRWGKG